MDGNGGPTAARLERLTEEFWAWRTVAAPDTSDDLTRLDRPAGWRPDWSAAAVARRRVVLAAYRRRHHELDTTTEPVPVQVDARLLGSALDRTHWELDLLRAWEYNPCFYINQSLVPLYNLLLVSTPMTAERADDVVGLLENTAPVLRQARENLDGTAVAPFAESALHKLSGVADRLRTAMVALAPELPSTHASRLPAATGVAIAALEEYQQWLENRIPGLRPDPPDDPRVLPFRLHRVGLLPYPADSLLGYARQEWARATTLEQVLRRRYGRPADRVADGSDLVERERVAEEEIRRLYLDRDLLSQPSTLRHYRYRARPSYLDPLTWLGECDDLTSVARRGEDAVRYVAPPGAVLPYFEQAAALDPRTTIVHEGVHAAQLALSWGNPRPARRHFYDSVPNEGIAFYNEELMLTAGAFDDSPAGALFVANAMRLRALRVEMDLGLALGRLGLDEATDQLATRVPMDTATARYEAVSFVGNVGQGLSYLTGKLQLQRLLADAAAGDGFDLRTFHDRVWREGNVPFALQRWEVLADRDELDAADQLATATGVGAAVTTGN